MSKWHGIGSLMLVFPNMPTVHECSFCYTLCILTVLVKSVYANLHVDSSLFDTTTRSFYEKASTFYNNSVWILTSHRSNISCLFVFFSGHKSKNPSIAKRELQIQGEPPTERLDRRQRD
jgi:hypothetical protein